MVMIGILIGCILFSGCLESAEDQKSKEIAKAVGPVALGNGVSAAYPYTKTTGIHPIALIDNSGGIDSWTSQIPKEWRPDSISEVQLVAVISKSNKAIQTCRYTGPSVTRYQHTVEISLREAKTGKLVKSGSLSGSTPPQCSYTERMSVTARYGSEVTFDQLKAWLKGYVVT